MLLGGLIIGLAFFTESALGFGGGLISIPLLTSFLGIKDAVTLVLLFQLLMGALLFDVARHVPRRLIRSMGVGLMLGTAFGMFSFFQLSEHVLKVALSMTIFLFLLGRAFRLPRAREWGIVPLSVAFLGGWLQGLIGTAGPVFTMYLSAASITKEECRSALIALFFVTSVMRILTALQTGIVTSSILQWALVAFPFYVVGVAAGRSAFRRVDDAWYRRCVLMALFVSAVLLLRS